MLEKVHISWTSIENKNLINQLWIHLWSHSLCPNSKVAVSQWRRRRPRVGIRLPGHQSLFWSTLLSSFVHKREEKTQQGHIVILGKQIFRSRLLLQPPCLNVHVHDHVFWVTFPWHICLLENSSTVLWAAVFQLLMENGNEMKNEPLGVLSHLISACFGMTYLRESYLRSVIRVQILSSYGAISSREPSYLVSRQQRRYLLLSCSPTSPATEYTEGRFIFPIPSLWLQNVVQDQVGSVSAFLSCQRDGIYVAH